MHIAAGGALSNIFTVGTVLASVTYYMTSVLQLAKQQATNYVHIMCKHHVTNKAVATD